MEKSKRRKLWLALLAAVVVLALAIGATAAVSAASLEEAKRTAGGSVPSAATLLSAERDGATYEIKYYDKATGEKFEVEVDRKTGQITEWESQAADPRGGRTVVLNLEDAAAAVQADLAEAEILGVELLEDDGYLAYRVAFRMPDTYGSYLIHPETGAVLERKVKYGTQTLPTTTPGESQPATGTDNTILSVDRIKELALEQVSGAVISDLDYEQTRTGPVYEVELYRDGYEYELVLDAVTGEKRSLRSHRETWDNEDDVSWNYTHGAPVTPPQTETDPGSDAPVTPASPDDIGLARAKEIAQAKAPSATFGEVKADLENGRKVYEGELFEAGAKYEFEIDAATGNILKWEREALTAPPSAPDGGTSQLIGEQRARELAQAKASEGAQLVELHLDSSDGRTVYEGELRKGTTEYEFKIDAYTGAFLEWDVDVPD